LNGAAAQSAAFARQLILQVLRQRGRRHQQPHGRAATARGVAQFVQYQVGLAGAGGPNDEAHRL